MLSTVVCSLAIGRGDIDLLLTYMAWVRVYRGVAGPRLLNLTVEFSIWVL